MLFVKVTEIAYHLDLLFVVIIQQHQPIMEGIINSISKK